MACKNLFWSEFPNIPDKAGRKTRRRRRRRTQVIAKPYTIHANTTKSPWWQVKRLRVKPIQCIIILSAKTLIYYVSLLWKFFWKSETHIFNAPVNKYILTKFKMQAPPQTFQQSLLRNIFWKSRWHDSNLNITSKWSSYPSPPQTFA